MDGIWDDMDGYSWLIGIDTPWKVVVDWGFTVVLWDFMVISWWFYGDFMG